LNFAKLTALITCFFLNQVHVREQELLVANAKGQVLLKLVWTPAVAPCMMLWRQTKKKKLELQFEGSFRSNTQPGILRSESYRVFSSTQIIALSPSNLTKQIQSNS
jgi:hypothetical protein